MPNIVNYPIVSGEKIIFPSLHIKPGMMKQFVRELNTDGEGFQHKVFALPAWLLKRIKAGVFDLPRIRAPVRDQDFVRKIVTMSAFSIPLALLQFSVNFL